MKPYTVNDPAVRLARDEWPAVHWQTVRYRGEAITGWLRAESCPRAIPVVAVPEAGDPSRWRASIGRYERDGLHWTPGATGPLRRVLRDLRYCLRFRIEHAIRDELIRPAGTDWLQVQGLAAVAAEHAPDPMTADEIRRRWRAP